MKEFIFAIAFVACILLTMAFPHIDDGEITETTNKKPLIQTEFK